MTSSARRACINVKQRCDAADVYRTTTLEIRSAGRPGIPSPSARSVIADGRCDVDVAQTHDRRLPPPDGRSRRSREVPQRSVLESEAACLGRSWLPEYEADVLANQCLEGAMRLPRSHAVPSPACTGSSRNRVCPLAKSVEMTPATPAVVAQKGSEGEKRAPERRFLEPL